MTRLPFVLLSIALDALYRVSGWGRAGAWGCRFGGVAIKPLPGHYAARRAAVEGAGRKPLT